ncbi:MAG TPA: membrane dipeptidase [Phycisphaerales bacterium]|nr:membrane dipeptidase [Phycisphaerales bacterium]
MPQVYGAVAVRWFDAHLDLAAIAANGRDMHAADPAVCPKPWPPGSVTLSSLRDGGVGACLATIFCETGGVDDATAYPSGDADAAAARGREQLEIYERWRRDGNIAITGRDSAGPTAPLRVGILIEGADPVASPGELAWWKERGVVAMGLTWARSSRYAGGNLDKHGLTPEGRAMVKAADALGVVHDASHLSDAALEDLFGATDRPVIATHSNCRALLDEPGAVEPSQRHITDAAIREIARRGGVIGLNLFGKFLVPRAEAGRAATIDDAAAHVERVCELTGSVSHVGLGSDMDGGFSANDLPAGIRLPRDLERLATALRNRGWSDADTERFAWRNWARVFPALAFDTV